MGGGRTRLDLAVTLSIHNTSESDSLVLDRIAVAPARFEQRARHGEIGGEGPTQIDLLSNRRHLGPRVEDMRDAMALENLAMYARQQLGIS